MRKKSFLIAVCIFAAFAAYGQSSTMLGTWTLDSIKVSELSADNKEIQVDYDEVKDSISKYVFDKIDIGLNNQSKLIRGEEEITASSIITDDLFTLKYEDEILSYKYTFKGRFFFKGKFSGINSKGQKIQYIIQMWLIYAQDKQN